MLESFLTVLGGTVANKKVLGAWLILLSMATAQVGSTVYGHRVDLAVVSTKLDAIQKTMDEIKIKADETLTTVNEMRVEQARVKAQLEKARK